MTCFPVQFFFFFSSTLGVNLSVVFSLGATLLPSNDNHQSPPFGKNEQAANYINTDVDLKTKPFLVVFRVMQSCSCQQNVTLCIHTSKMPARHVSRVLQPAAVVTCS